MGCWNETCYLSNLPIFSGEKIVVIPLMKIRTGEEHPHPCNVADNYMPIGFPIFGEYNDYGGIENATTSQNNRSHLYKMEFFVKDSKNDAYIKIAQNSSFDDFINETFCGGENVYVSVQNNYFFPDNKAPVTFMMMHRDIYYEVLAEVGNRIPYNKDANFHTVLLESSKRKYSSIISHNILSICERNELDDEKLRGYMEVNRLNQIRKLSDEIFGQAFRFHRTIWDDLSTFILDNPDELNGVLKDVVNLVVFATALSFVRKGFLANTGRGSQDCETRLHMIIAEFIKQHIIKYAKKSESVDGADVSQGIAEDVFFYEE